jgi:hypothetical protein
MFVHKLLRIFSIRLLYSVWKLLFGLVFNWQLMHAFSLMSRFMVSISSERLSESSVSWSMTALGLNFFLKTDLTSASTSLARLSVEKK